MTARISLIPLVTAEKSMNFERVTFAITFARVVFPTPGGPQKIIDAIASCSTIRRKTFPSPRSRRCPTISSRD